MYWLLMAKRNAQIHCPSCISALPKTWCSLRIDCFYTKNLMMTIKMVQCQIVFSQLFDWNYWSTLLERATNSSSRKNQTKIACHLLSTLLRYANVTRLVILGIWSQELSLKLPILKLQVMMGQLKLKANYSVQLNFILDFNGLQWLLLDLTQAKK